MSGAQVENLKVHELAADINDVNVFYRASPRHKLKIVKVIFVYIYTLFQYFLKSSAQIQIEIVKVDCFLYKYQIVQVLFRTSDLPNTKSESGRHLICLDPELGHFMLDSNFKKRSVTGFSQILNSGSGRSLFRTYLQKVIFKSLKLFAYGEHMKKVIIKYLGKQSTKILQSCIQPTKYFTTGTSATIPHCSDDG